MRGADIRRLCDEAMGEPPVVEFSTVETDKTASAETDPLLDRLDEALDGAASDGPERDGKTAIAMLLVAGDVLAQSDVA